LKELRNGYRISYSISVSIVTTNVQIMCCRCTSMAELEMQIKINNIIFYRFWVQLSHKVKFVNSSHEENGSEYVLE